MKVTEITNNILASVLVGMAVGQLEQGPSSMDRVGFQLKWTQIELGHGMKSNLLLHDSQTFPVD